MIKTSIVCDSCKRENCAPWFLCLSSLIVSTSDINWITPIDGTSHFCGEKCLSNWLESRKKQHSGISGKISDEILHSIDCNCQECLDKWKILNEHVSNPD